jgi:Fe-S-cluster containining protein
MDRTTTPIRWVEEDDAAGSPAAGFVRLQTDLPAFEQALRIVLDVPRRRLRLAQIVPIAYRIDEAMLAASVTHAQTAGQTVYCKPTCTHCCKYVVGFSYPEACYLLDVLTTLDEPRRSRLVQWFRDMNARIEAEGIAAVVETAASMDAGLSYLGQWLHEQGIACPFLEDDLCSIYEHRSTTCRDYVSLSPPQTCADLNTARLPRPFGVGLALSLLHAHLADCKPGLVVLPMFAGFIENRATRGREAYDGVMMTESLLTILSDLAEQGRADIDGTVGP